MLMLVQGCTDSCEPGPFFTNDAPEIPSGSAVASDNTVGEHMYFSATVKDTKGDGIAGVKAEMVRHLLLFAHFNF